MVIEINDRMAKIKSTLALFDVEYIYVSNNTAFGDLMQLKLRLNGVLRDWAQIMLSFAKEKNELFSDYLSIAVVDVTKRPPVSVSTLENIEQYVRNLYKDSGVSVQPLQELADLQAKLRKIVSRIDLVSKKQWTVSFNEIVDIYDYMFNSANGWDIDKSDGDRVSITNSTGADGNYSLYVPVGSIIETSNATIDGEVAGRQKTKAYPCLLGVVNAQTTTVKIHSAIFDLSIQGDHKELISKWIDGMLRGKSYEILRTYNDRLVRSGSGKDLNSIMQTYGAITVDNVLVPSSWMGINGLTNSNYVGVLKTWARWINGALYDVDNISSIFSIV
jgi:hypothetical protein